VTFNVRRNLFGCCSDSTGPSVSESLAEQETECAIQSSKVWNFDFVSESPLPAGRYAWEKVRDCDVPVFYATEGRDDEEGLSLTVAQLPKKVDIGVYHQLSEDLSKETSGNNLYTNENQSVVQLPTKEVGGKCCQASKKKNVENRCKEIKLVQTSIKAYTKVQKRRHSKRMSSKSGTLQFLKRSPRVVELHSENSR